jgi:hypothetical protein
MDFESSDEEDDDEQMEDANINSDDESYYYVKADTKERNNECLKTETVTVSQLNHLLQRVTINKCERLRKVGKSGGREA